MPLPVQSLAALAAGQPLVPYRFERRDLRDDDVRIQIHYCGLCHSDLHMVRNDWGWTRRWPLVPGHEILGRVSAVGPAVRRHRVGDWVGVGCMVDSCRACTACRRGWQQYCENGNTATYGGVDRIDGSPTQGGYSTAIVVQEDFVLRLPDGLHTPAAAPLLCAGITTWSPLRHWKVGPGSRVAVVGLGGLGHMAIKLARALGAQVSLFTRSPTKVQDALALGAHEVILSDDKARMKAAAGHFDLILDTVPCTHDINPYIPTLALEGTLVLLGLMGNTAAPLRTTPLVFGRRSVAASVIGGIEQTQEMLDFCARHRIVADVQTITAQDIQSAFERMERGEVKYRFVLDAGSLE